MVLPATRTEVAASRINERRVESDPLFVEHLSPLWIEKLHPTSNVARIEVGVGRTAINLDECSIACPIALPPFDTTVSRES